MSKQFTVITKDGSKWLRPTDVLSDVFNVIYLGSAGSGTVLSEEQVIAITQARNKEYSSGNWFSISEKDADWNDFEIRTAYTDADRDVDYEKEMPHKQWASTKYVARKVDNGWTHISDALPEHLETVWLSNGKGFTTLGCLVWTEDGWHWAATNGVIYEENSRIVSECESDDIDAEYWHRLPDALRIDKEDLI